MCTVKMKSSHHYQSRTTVMQSATCVCSPYSHDKQSQKMNEADVVSRQSNWCFSTVFFSTLHVNCKPPFFSSSVFDGDSPSSALMISLAGSCTCGVSEYSSEMTVSQMWVVRMTSSSWLTVRVNLFPRRNGVSSVSSWTVCLSLTEPER